MLGDSGSHKKEEEQAERGFVKLHRRNPTTGRLNQVLKCAFCDSEFKKLCNVLDHVRMHVGSKPFVCEDCGLAFA